MRALAAFRREFKLFNYDNLDIFVLSYDDRDVSAEHVFGEESDVVFFTKGGGKRRALEARGHEARKANLEKRSAGERADVVIMLDPSIQVTKRLVEHVEPGGWILCRIGAANSLRARGKYEFKGVIEKSGEGASISRREDATFWKSVEVDSEESFRQASGAEDVVSYEEAKQKVGDAGFSESDVFKSYSKLIRMAEEQNPELLARGETLLPCRLTVDGKEIEIMVNTALPAKAGEHDDAIIVMHKKLIA